MLVGPALVVFLGFVIFPVVMAGYYGFFRWKGFGPPTDFIGLQNYVTIFQDPTFHEALWHNAVIVVMSLVLQGPIALLLALLLNRPMRGQSVIRVLIFVPYVLAEVVVGTGWSLMLQTDGALNGLLEKIGLGASPRTGSRTPSWRSGPCWGSSPGSTSASPSSSSSPASRAPRSSPKPPRSTAPPTGRSSADHPAAARPDPAHLPFLSIIGSLQLFDLVYIIWGQYIASTAGTSTMATYMVANGRNAGNYGYGNAVAVVLFLISLVVALVYQRYVLRRDTAGALTERSAR